MATRDKSVWILIVFILAGIVVGGVKNNKGINSSVIVNNQISHTNNFIPRYFIKLIFKIIR